MAYNVKFLKGLDASYQSITTKDENTFYYTSDSKDLYLGTIKLSNASDLDAAILRIAANEANIGDITTLTTSSKTDLVAAVNSIKSELTALVGDGSGGIADMIEAVTGNLDDLDTTAKNTLVAAINELNEKITEDETAAKVTVESTESSEYSKVYTIKQGGTAVGSINIPKDMVVSAGEVVVNPDGQAAGTYIVLTLANATNDKIYVNVGTLVDIYKAAGNATQVQLAVDSTTREISATIVAGSITATELASNAVTTAKIADGQVTLAKLATSVQTSLGKADSAVQSIATGSANGTIAVDGTDVAVAGLDSAAYASVDDFDPAGSADAALTSAKAYTDAALTWGSF